MSDDLAPHPWELDVEGARVVVDLELHLDGTEDPDARHLQMAGDRIAELEISTSGRLAGMRWRPADRRWRCQRGRIQRSRLNGARRRGARGGRALRRHTRVRNRRWRVAHICAARSAF